MSTLTSSGTFTVTAQASATAAISTVVLPPVAYPNGQGRIVHPTLGAFDYDYTPDEWTNIDGDVFALPTWALTKSLSGFSSSLWKATYEDITCEERWTALGGLAMPISQLRMLLACAMNPIDPNVALMQWYPNYTTGIGYYVLMLDVTVGNAGTPGMAHMDGFSTQAMVLNDIVNAVSDEGGWVDKPVTIFWKIVGKVQVNG